MKKLLLLMILVVPLVFAEIPNLNNLQNQAAAAAQEAAELGVLVGLVRGITPVEFKVVSSALELSDPNFNIAGYDVDSLMKQVIIPALSDIANKLPTDKKIALIGHASATGPEEASATFIGNKVLSQKRAEAVLAYLQANSSLSSDKFIVVANGSSTLLAGKNGADSKNCRVSFDIQ